MTTMATLGWRAQGKTSRAESAVIARSEGVLGSGAATTNHGAANNRRRSPRSYLLRGRDHHKWSSSGERCSGGGVRRVEGCCFATTRLSKHSRASRCTRSSVQYRGPGRSVALEARAKAHPSLRCCQSQRSRRRLPARAPQRRGKKRRLAACIGRFAAPREILLYADTERTSPPRSRS